MTEGRRQPGFFLPDFCNVRMVFVVVLISELLAFVLTLAPLAPADRWSTLSLTSLYAQWLGLSSAAVLCLSRPFLARIDERLAAGLSYVLLLAVALALAEAAFHVVRTYGLGLEVTAEDHAGFVLRTLGIAAIIDAVVLRYLYIQHRWKEQVRAESQARFEALQARIRPHFLFNTMNTIASLTREQPEAAERAIEDLSDLLRASLTGEGWVSLPQEVELCRRFLDIEQLRLGSRLQTRWVLTDIPDDTRIPALTLQPLVENAVYHGIEPRSEGGTISIFGRRNGGMIEVIIENPLPADGAAAARQGSHIALANLRERLTAAFGEYAEVATEAASQRYRVRIDFPYWQEAP